MTRMMTRRGMVLSIAAVLAAAGCASGTSGGSSGSDTANSSSLVKVRIPDPGNAGVLAVGKKDGSLDKALAAVGAEAVWTGSAGPFAPAAQEMAANELDIAQGSITSAVTSLAATPVFKLFAQDAPDHIGEGVLVPAGSSITSVKDLVGKSVAVNKGGTGEYLLRKALSWAGIPASKVTFVYLNPAQTAPVLNSGKVDAWATWSSYSVAEVGLDNAHFVATGGQVGSENYSVWAVRSGFASKYPKVVDAFYQYLHDEGTKVAQDPASSINVFTTAGPQALSGNEITFDSKDIEGIGTTNPITAAVTTQFESVATFFASEGVTKDVVNVKPYVINDVGTSS
ncbi:MAG: NrtA/SsuA/CpmA family ABC transporter substrate-binding protein [Trebonia sp.]